MKVINFICLGLGLFLVIGGIGYMFEYPNSVNGSITMSVGALFSGFGFSAIIYREGLKENKKDMKIIIRRLELLNNSDEAHKLNQLEKMELLNQLDNLENLDLPKL